MKVNPRRQAARTEVHAVTDAPRPLSEDIAQRQRRYLVSMGIRTGCFLGAVAAALAGAPFWLTGALIVGAVFLPYIAVVVANAGRAPVAPTRFSTPQSQHHKGISGQHPEIGS
ncbi:DUF3099 domain-containing protein [Actinomadura parmotrematis]|uniref:DUF3099 domain-containing protein n=1 Tax=Actinomadura parmotrematis TaxID=2864039 RepID=A0ABS7FSG4_9ACTN|nr:DUF3099 domain-containing protein [Actinomadura parmotrematis]MBW8483359.1 DUF3099 domain-containing protein [Actinomadura parmotrematis]